MSESYKNQFLVFSTNNATIYFNLEKPNYDILWKYNGRSVTKKGIEKH
jgi:hypothetical protein